LQVQSPKSKVQSWDNLLASAGASLLQSYQWGEFKRASGWTPGRLADNSPASGPKPEIASQVLFRTIPKLPLPISVAYIPRGPVYLASDVDKEQEAAFWRKVHVAARKRGAIFLKVEPNIALDDNVKKADVDARMVALGFRPSGRLQPARTIVLDIGQGEDELLKAMKPKTRYNLRLAGRRGVTIRRAETLDDLRAFFSLLEVTGTRDEFGIHTFPYYRHLWDTFGPGGSNTLLILLADHPDEAERQSGPIAGLLALRFGHEAIYMYGASDNRGREHMPNYLLQWEAIRWARQNECTIYDFWGIPDPPTEDDSGEEGTAINARSGLRGVYWFKKGFGGREIDYPGAYDYVYKPLLYKLWMRWRGSNLG
jgi:lipid II:glycine glycyltransferase (peptidoglycan interpeptide bridge formation enzyme)